MLFSSIFYKWRNFICVGFVYLIVVIIVIVNLHELIQLTFNCWCKTINTSLIYKINNSGNHVETDWFGGCAHAFGLVALGVGGNYIWYLEYKLSYHNKNQNSFTGNVNISAYGFTYTFYHMFTSWYGVGNTRRDAPNLPTAANA